MFATPKTKTKLEKEIDYAFEKLRDQTMTSEEYGTVLERFLKMHKLQAEIQPQRVSPDTVVLAVTNLLGIIMIIKHEHVNVISSKAMSFVHKPR